MRTHRLAMAKAMWRWAGWLPGAVILVGARELFIGMVSEDRQLIFNAIAAALTCAAIWLFAIWVVHLFCMPKQRFKATFELILTLARKMDSNRLTRDQSIPDLRLSAETKALLWEAIDRMDEFAVPHPPFAYSIDRWLVFLSRILVDSRTGNLARARIRWAKMKEEDGDRGAP